MLNFNHHRKKAMVQAQTAQLKKGEAEIEILWNSRSLFLRYRNSRSLFLHYRSKKAQFLRNLKMEVKPDTPNHSKVKGPVIGTLKLNVLVKIQMTTRKVYLVFHQRIKKGLLRLMDLQKMMFWSIKKAGLLSSHNLKTWGSLLRKSW